MISRSNTIPAILFHALHYEGHPCLWYLLLWVPSHLHVPYHYINWISGACGTAAIYLLLRYSPFPLYLKMLIPFGFALQYQYAVVARSYALFPLLGFACAHIYRCKKNNSVAMGVALALFANISIYSTAVALGVGICYWKRLACRESSPNHLPLCDSKTLAGLVIFASSLGLVLVSVWPPPYLRARLIQAWRHGQSANIVTLSSEMPRGNPPLPSYPAENSPTNPYRTLSYGNRVATRLYPVLANPVAAWYPLAFAFEATLLIYLLRSNEKLLILPIMLLVMSLIIGYQQIWHVQMLWVTFILVLWMAWDTEQAHPRGSMQLILSFFFSILCMLQLPWTLGAMIYELHHSTYPADDAAVYVGTMLASKRIGGTGLAFTLRPYFQQEVFAFFSELQVSYVIASHPDVIVGDSKEPASDIDQLSGAGYRPIRSFCGASYFPNVPIRPGCLIIYKQDKVVFTER